ncbi:Adaptor protein complex beta subunit [Ramicandelaber brevisporus]|nr:Adaptor protein complex beta subunit [Ramicandelaber brevisporus]
MTGGGDARLFQRDKLHELHAELTADKDPRGIKRRLALKKVIANMTLGNDVSALYPDVLACMTSPQLEVKKMVYLFIINYARTKPEMPVAAIPHFVADASSTNPLVRALAIRTMSYIYSDKVVAALVDPLRRCLRDADPYVRKTAALCVAKLWVYDRALVDEEQFINMVKDLLVDSNPSVVANAVAALTEISERAPNVKLRLNVKIGLKLAAVLNHCSEWGQVYILEALMYVVPQQPGDAEALAERIVPRLQHANTGVVLTTIKVILYLMNYMTNQEAVDNLTLKMGPPLITLLSSGIEMQYVALRNIAVIVQRRPEILANQIRPFFCKYDDPIGIKLAKLGILLRLATPENAPLIIQELAEYATEIDVEFVRRAVRAIGRIAIKFERCAKDCISTLMNLIQTGVNYVVQETIVVMRDIFRRYPNRYEHTLGVLCRHLDSLDEPDAKAAMVWIIGQYCDRIDDAHGILESFLDTLLEEPAHVQLSLLTATVKLFVKRPAIAEKTLPRVLKMVTEQVDNPDLRDRGFFYWRLLSADAARAKTIMFAPQSDISGETDDMEPVLLDELLLNVSSLAAVHHKPPSQFINGAKRRTLPASAVLNALRPAGSGDKIQPLSNPATLAAVTDFMDALDLGSGSRNDAVTADDFSMTLDTSVPPPLPPKEPSLMMMSQPQQQLPLMDDDGAPDLMDFGEEDAGNEEGDLSGSLVDGAGLSAGGLAGFAPAAIASNLDIGASAQVLSAADFPSPPPGTGVAPHPGSINRAFTSVFESSLSLGTTESPVPPTIPEVPEPPPVVAAAPMAAASREGEYIGSSSTLLHPSQTNGLEVAGAFVRRDGGIFLELVFANHSSQPIGDFAIQFNKNTFGLTGLGALQVPSPIPPGSMADASPLQLQVNAPNMVQPSTPLANLQVALKSSLGVFYFQTLVSLHVFFAENGALGQSEFLREFSEIPDSEQHAYSISSPQLTALVDQQRAAAVLGNNASTNAVSVRNKLHRNNIFVVAERTLDGVAHYYCSVRLLGGTLFVLEIKIGTDAVATVSTKTTAPADLVEAFHTALEAVLASGPLAR